MDWLMEHFDRQAMASWSFWLFAAIMFAACIAEAQRRRR